MAGGECVYFLLYGYHIEMSSLLVGLLEFIFAIRVLPSSTSYTHDFSTTLPPRPPYLFHISECVHR